MIEIVGAAGGRQERRGVVRRPGTSRAEIRRRACDRGVLRVVSPAAAIVLGYGAAAPSEPSAALLYSAVAAGSPGARQLEVALEAVPRVKESQDALERSVSAAPRARRATSKNGRCYKVFNTAEFCASSCASTRW